MFLRAGGSEGAGDGEENGFLVGGEGRDGGSLKLTGGVEVREGGVGELFADGNGGGDDWAAGGSGGERKS